MTLQNIKNEFPLLRHHARLVYLDSVASTLIHRSVLRKMEQYYTEYGVNIDRGIYTSSVHATQEYENARATIAQFIGAQNNEVIFTSGATAGLNMIAHGLMHLIGKNSNIVVTAMEHHANFVPWQQILQIAQNNTQNFRVVQITKDGQIDLTDFAQKIDRHTAIVALPYISNVLGTINPIKEIVAQVRKINPDTIVVVDTAQTAGGPQIDVRDWDCDFLVLSGHKLYGPTGVGVLYGKQSQLEKLTPLLFGGGMIAQVAQTRTTFAPLPQRLEAGTPPIAQAIGLAQAIRFMEDIGWDTITQHEKELTAYALTQLRTTFGDAITIYGPQSIAHRGSIISFSLSDIHPHDIAQILDEADIAIRAGQHCAQPLHRDYLKISATARISFGIYNTRHDIDRLIVGLKKAQDTFTQ